MVTELLSNLVVAHLKAALEGKAPARPRAKRDADGRSAVAPKYRNPADPSQTWSGRGRPPTWIELGGEMSPKSGKPLPLPKFLILERPAEEPEPFSDI